VRTLLARDDAIQVQNPEELKPAMAELLANVQHREQLGQNALAVFRENLGGIDRTVEMIVQHLEGGELYIAPRKSR